MMTPPSDIDRRLAVPPAFEPSPQRKRKPKGNPHAGRFELLNSFVDTALAGCTGAEVAVWLVLYRDTRNGTARTAQAWIATRAGIDARTVRRALGSLKRRGLVSVLKHGGPTAGIAIYRVRATPTKGGGHVQ